MNYRTYLGEEINMDIEIWKHFISYNNQYFTIRTNIEISNYGNVRGEIFDRERFTQELIKIKSDGRKFIKNTPIYSLVWKLFNGEKPKGYVIHHIDHNKLNDRLDNLELMKRGEHIRHHNIGRKAWNKGLTKEDDTRIAKHSCLMQERKRKKGWKHSTKTKEFFTKQRIGRHWFNNGIVSVFTYECPNGFTSGRIYKRKNK